MKNLFTALFVLISVATLACAQTEPPAAAPAEAQTQPQTQSPPQDQMLIDAANRKTQRTLAEMQRDSSVVYLRLMGEMEKAQRHAEVQQEQARLDLAAKIALAETRLAKGAQDKGQQLRQAFTTELTQACQAFNQRLAEIDAEQNQSYSQALQRFNQQRAEVREGYNRDIVANAQRLTQEMAAPDLGATVASFKVTLPSFAQPAGSAAEAEADDALQAAYRQDVDGARKAYTQAVNEARAKVVTNIQRSLDAAPEGTDEEQATAIKNSIRRLGLWAADSMDSYQISLKSALRKYQLGENAPPENAKQAGSKQGN